LFRGGRRGQQREGEEDPHGISVCTEDASAQWRGFAGWEGGRGL
jgi:hypothetical protein